MCQQIQTKIRSVSEKIPNIGYFIAGFALCFLLVLTQKSYSMNESQIVSQVSDSSVLKGVVRTEAVKLYNSMKKPDHTADFPTTATLPADQVKRILITGGAGFIGSHLTDVLMMQGHRVTVIDNLFTGRRKNIQHWEGHPHFEFIRHDVIEPFMMEVDQIYHLACPASPPHYQYNPIKTLKTSMLGTMNMLGLAKRVNASILFTSTSEVYGDPEKHPQQESYFGNVNPIGPRSCYDEGKRVGETLCYEYQRKYNLRVRIARIFNTYGPRMHPDDGRVVSNFVIQALKGEPITIYGSGNQTRSFQYCSDLVRGLVMLMNSDIITPVNIGNPTESTIQHFAEHIRDKIRPDGEIIHSAATQDDPRKRNPDITKAKELLGWQPTVVLDEGLERTIKYFTHELGLVDESEENEAEKIPVVWMTPELEHI